MIDKAEATTNRVVSTVIMHFRCRMVSVQTVGKSSEVWEASLALGHF
jgi:hypothetical protein